MSFTAIIDIGSTSVGGALVFDRLLAKTERSGQEKVCGRIVFSTRNEINFQEKTDNERYLRGIEEVLRKTSDDLLKTRLGAPKKIICFLSAPFYAAQTRLLRYVKPEPFVVNRQLVSELLSGIVSNQRERLNLDKKHLVIENHILSFKLNGYEVHRQVSGQRVKQVEISNFVSLASADILNRFRRTLLAVFHQPAIEFHSFIFPLFRVLDDIVSLSSGAFIVDVGGETTEVSLIWQGIIWDTISFPMGRNFVLRRLSDALRTTLAEAHSVLNLYLGGGQLNESAEQIERALTSAKKEWLEDFLIAVDEIMEGCLMPSETYLIGDNQTLPLFRRWLEQNVLEQNVIGNNLSLGRKKNEVVALGAQLFSVFCDKAALVVEDTSLMIETLFYDKMRHATVSF